MNANNKTYAEQLNIISFWLATFICLSMGVVSAYGGCRWIISIIKERYITSYADYMMVIVLVSILTELWAIFIQVPNIYGYSQYVSQRLDCCRIIIGSILMCISVILLTIYTRESDSRGNLHTFLVKSLYTINGHSIKDYDALLDELDEIIDREGTNDVYYAERGSIYYEMAEIKNGNKKRGVFNKTERQNSLTADECYSLALNNYDNAIGLNDSEADYYFKKGLIQFKDRNSTVENAKKSFEKAIELGGYNPEHYYYASCAWFELLKNSQLNQDINIRMAVDRINTAIRIGKEYDWIHHSDDENDNINQSTLYYQLGIINSYLVEQHISLENNENASEMAISSFAEAIILDDQKQEYYVELGKAYTFSDNRANLEKALKAFDRAIEINKRQEDYAAESINLAWKAFSREYLDEDSPDNYDSNVRDYLDSIKYNPSYAYSYERLGELYSLHNEPFKAIDLYCSAINKCSEWDSSMFYYKRGQEFYDQELYVNAIRDMREAIRKDAMYCKDGYWYIASAYFYIEQFEDAYDNYELAIQNGYEESLVAPWMEKCKEEVDTKKKNK